ncbi:ROK family protein [Pantoea sp.]|uniref:ROK family protein n=1 Tax=Pantoea sp. TaxID=69393 RepID=UPI002899C70D|nr:ROK family protein [Pantoea sp.]
MKLAAFDIGGTSLKMGVTTDLGEIVKKEQVEVQQSSGKEILEHILQWVKDNPDCEGIAISVPGHVDAVSGTIFMGGTVRDFDRFNIVDWLAKETSLPVTVENDAHCALLAERWLGKAQSMADFLMITIGTGVGGAIFCNNALVHGKGFSAGEFGRMLTSRPASDGVSQYTMDKTCTMSSLREYYSLHMACSQEEVSGEDVFAKYDEGDPICSRLVITFYQDICAAIYNLAHIFDPECIFFGGGITAREQFLEEIKFHLAWFGLEIKLDTATHGNDSGMLGASWHFLQQHKDGDKNHQAP